MLLMFVNFWMSWKIFFSPFRVNYFICCCLYANIIIPLILTLLGHTLATDKIKKQYPIAFMLFLYQHPYLQEYVLEYWSDKLFRHANSEQSSKFVSNSSSTSPRDKQALSMIEIGYLSSADRGVLHPHWLIQKYSDKSPPPEYPPW